MCSPDNRRLCEPHLHLLLYALVPILRIERARFLLALGKKRRVVLEIRESVSSLARAVERRRGG